MIVPPAPGPTDRVAVVAPSSPFEHTLAWRALGVLARAHRVDFDRGMFERRGFLAGGDARREAELARALRAPGVGVILAARGGHGALRFVHRLPWGALRDSPRWIVGFSDVTALHVEAARVGVASLHAPHLTALGRSDARSHRALLEAIADPARPRAFPGLEVVVPGEARGPLFGGNLTVLHACAAAGRLQVPDGAVLLLEDVTERPYRIDRMLVTLAVGGHLDRVAAVALGDFTACDPGPDGVSVREVLVERLGSLGVPVVAGLPVGHEARNEPVALGMPARVLAPAGGPGSLATADPG